MKNYERVKGQRGFYICSSHLESERSIEHLEKELSTSLKPSYQRADRSKTTVNRLKRNVKLSEKIKELYNHKCQSNSINPNLSQSFRTNPKKRSEPFGSGEYRFGEL